MSSSLRLKLLRRFYQLRREVEQRLRPTKTVYVWHRVPYYRQLWEEACEICGFTLTELRDDTWEVRDNGEPVTRINNCYLELDDPVTLTIAGNKRVTYRLLEEAGLPVAPHRAFSLDDLAPMDAFIESNPGPFVIKPSYGTGSGIGVTTHLTSRRDAVRAAVQASLHCPELLIEQQVPGEVYRLLYLGDRVIAASRRRGMRVKGDGVRSVRELYLRERPEGLAAATWLADPDFVHTAPLQGFAHDEVVAEGREVLVKSVAARMESTSEVRTVYDQDAFDELAPEIIAAAEAAASTLRSEFCGVDLITTDSGRPLEETGGVIGEINTTPGLHHHYRLDGPGDAPHIGARVLRYIVAKADKNC